MKTGSTAIAETNSKIDAKTDQFICRLLPNRVTGQLQLLNELIVRLENGFPTTEREARQFEERQEANLQALARNLLGKVIQRIALFSFFFSFLTFLRILFLIRRRRMRQK